MGTWIEDMEGTWVAIDVEGVGSVQEPPRNSVPINLGSHSTAAQQQQRQPARHSTTQRSAAREVGARKGPTTNSNGAYLSR